MFSAEHIYKHFSDKGTRHTAVTDFSGSFSQSVTAIIGANGSGKSTLLKVLCSIDKPSSGTVYYNDAPLKGRNLQNFREQIGYVPQDVNFVPSMTCHDALAYSGWVSGMDKVAIRKRIPEALSLVNLNGMERKKTKTLSGGQNRRLGIAAAILHNPKILFLDEPTAGLDPSIRNEIRQTLSTLSDSTKIILSTHLTNDLEEISTDTSVIALDRGVTSYDGPWSALKAKTLATVSNTSASQDLLEDVLTMLKQQNNGKDVNDDSL